MSVQFEESLVKVLLLNRPPIILIIHNFFAQTVSAMNSASMMESETQFCLKTVQEIGTSSINSR